MFFSQNNKKLLSVIPAKAGIQPEQYQELQLFWIPAYAGMTRYFSVILIMILLPFLSSAKQPDYDCKENEGKILKALKRFPYCNSDDECRYFDYGYPWQKDACVKAIVSTYEETSTIRYLKAIEEYNKNCVYNNEVENKKFTELQESLKTQECKKLPRLFCLKGVCRNQFYPMFFDDAGSIR